LPLALVFVFAPEILGIWLGPQYAAQSATALRWLAVGVFANALANPLFVALYAKDRPDMPAKFHLLELAVHIPLTIYLIRLFGIAGAAAAWTSRAILDLALLLWGSARLSRSPVFTIVGGRAAQTAAGIVVFLATLFVGRALTTISTIAGVATAVVASSAFAVYSWKWILGDFDRAAIAGTLGSYARLVPASWRGRVTQ
jgi:O-antigen/teichoic acid export membrane protein